METIRAIIVEDEELGASNLLEKIKRKTPYVDILHICRSGEEAVEMIPKLGPELVFLDIQMGSMNGFDVLERLWHFQFEVIFTTGYDQYVIDAIRVSALDYLVKPIDEGELENAILRAMGKRKIQPQHSVKVAIPIPHGIKFIGTEEITYCEGNDNRTVLHLFSGKTLDSNRTLGQIEEKLSGLGFIRIHKSYLINKHYLEEYSRKDDGYVLVSGEKKRLPISKGKAEMIESLFR